MTKCEDSNDGAFVVWFVVVGIVVLIQKWLLPNIHIGYFSVVTPSLGCLTLRFFDKGSLWPSLKMYVVRSAVILVFMCTFIYIDFVVVVEITDLSACLLLCANLSVISLLFVSAHCIFLLDFLSKLVLINEMGWLLIPLVLSAWPILAVVTVVMYAFSR